jgi:hypothetical protein
VAQRLRLKLNRSGMRQLLTSPGIAADVRRRAEAVAANAGPGHRIDSQIGPNRARAAVITDSFEARRAEATSRNLTRALSAARR